MSEELLPEDFPIGLTSKYGGKERGKVLQVTVGSSYVDLDRSNALLVSFQLKRWCNPANTMTFSDALNFLKLRYLLARRGWNGKGMYICLVSADQWGMGSAVPFDWGQVGNELRPWLGIKTVDNQFMPWVPSQSDVLAEDWEIYTAEK